MPVQKRPKPDTGRVRLESRWLDLTRNILPKMAEQRRWPIRADHCFQRVLLDAACEGRWYDHIVERPAYKASSNVILHRAVALGEQVTQEVELLPLLNSQSLKYRSKI